MANQLEAVSGQAPKQHRFWFGYLDAGPQSSLVVFDRRANRPSSKEAHLYHLKRNEIVTYYKAMVRQKLRDLKAEEWGLRDFALSSYFGALAKHNHDRESRLPEDIRQLRAELRAEAIEYEETHAGDRFKTELDWAVEYAQSDDPETRELGERMLRMIRGEESKHSTLEAAERDQISSNIMRDRDAEDGPL